MDNTGKNDILEMCMQVLAYTTNLQQTHGYQQAFLVTRLYKRCTRITVPISEDDLKEKQF